MNAAFTDTPKSNFIQETVQNRLKQAKNDNSAKVTVDWRGEQKHLYVISMPVDLLYLNPDTHRIRAQRTLDAVRNAKLDEDPWGEDAQQYLTFLLSRNPALPQQVDPEYVALKQELKDFGQKEPGIVSPTGIVVDGNTRCAALRELGVKDIRVGVLPEDTSRRDINNVELALQLRRDKRRDYSYINRLIAIEEELSSGRREEDVARDFNIKPLTLQRDRWVYQLIRGAIDRSKSSGVSLRLVDFEDHQEKLRELHRDFVRTAKIDVDKAEQLKESRLAMVLLNYPKTSLRLAEDDFHERYVGKRLPTRFTANVDSSGSVEIPGLPGATAPDASETVKRTRALTDSLLKAKAISEAGNKAKPTEMAEASEILSGVRATFDVALKMAGKNAELQKRQVVVSERITDAADYLNQCVSEFVQADANKALDADAFDDALLTLRASLEKLARLAGRKFSEPGAGVAWLLQQTEEPVQ